MLNGLYHVLTGDSLSQSWPVIPVVGFEVHQSIHPFDLFRPEGMTVMCMPVRHTKSSCMLEVSFKTEDLLTVWSSTPAICINTVVCPSSLFT